MNIFLIIENCSKNLLFWRFMSYSQNSKKCADMLAINVSGPTDAFCKTEITTLQVNVGLYCNQACNHCHVESSPKRQEMMSRAVAERCIHLLANSPSVTLLDLTGSYGLCYNLKIKSLNLLHHYVIFYFSAQLLTVML